MLGSRSATAAAVLVLQQGAIVMRRVGPAGLSRQRSSGSEAMIRFHVLLGMAALAVGLLSAAGPANAQATRTWVSGVGDDANPCSRTAPCQTFAGAFGKTSAGGEIDCLDPGGFGSLTITHAISIICDGASNGGITVGNESVGVSLDAGPADTVVLSGLDFEGNGVGVFGIVFNAGQALYVRNCVIRNLLNDGIIVDTLQTTPASLYVDNTTIVNASSPGNLDAGIYIVPQSSGPESVTINRTQVAGGSFGIVADGTEGTGKITGVVRDSVVSGNVQNGITVSNSLSPNISLLVDNVTVTNNGNNGLAANGANAGMIVSNSTISGNGGGLHEAHAGVIDSYGNNRVNANNGNDGAFSTTIPTK